MFLHRINQHNWRFLQVGSRSIFRLSPKLDTMGMLLVLQHMIYSQMMNLHQQRMEYIYLDQNHFELICNLINIDH